MSSAADLRKCLGKIRRGNSEQLELRLKKKMLKERLFHSEIYNHKI